MRTTDGDYTFVYGMDHEYCMYKRHRYDDYLENMSDEMSSDSNSGDDDGYEAAAVDTADADHM
jgi:hypothetical protein